MSGPSESSEGVTISKQPPPIRMFLRSVIRLQPLSIRAPFGSDQMLEIYSVYCIASLTGAMQILNEGSQEIEQVGLIRDIPILLPRLPAPF